MFAVLEVHRTTKTLNQGRFIKPVKMWNLEKLGFETNWIISNSFFLNSSVDVGLIVYCAFSFYFTKNLLPEAALGRLNKILIKITGSSIVFWQFEYVTKTTNELELCLNRQCEGHLNCTPLPLDSALMHTTEHLWTWPGAGGKTEFWNYFLLGHGQR